MEFTITRVVEDPVEEGIVSRESYTSDTDTAITGTWVELEAPVISSGGLVDDDDDPATALVNLKYPGYDYFALSNTSYPNGDATTHANHWQYGTVVQIFTPKKTSAASVYYEIGERRKVLSDSEYGESQQPTQNHGSVFKTMVGS